MQTLENGVQLFTNGDAYNLADDMATAFNSANVITLVADDTARDALAKFDGFTVRRLDLPGRPTEVWDGTVWHRAPVIASTDLTEDGFWDITGGLMRTVTAGFTQVTASFQMVRTVGAITINTTDSTLIIGAIPAGFRPPGNASFVAPVNTNTGARYAEPQLILNNGGSIVGRSTSGGSIVIGVGYTMFVSISWTI